MSAEADHPIPLRHLERESTLTPDRIPVTAAEFLDLLEVPSLISVRGRDRGRTRVLSTLLHGNEPSGVCAVRSWLASGRTPATDVLILIGAVRTARAEPGFAHRFLPGRIDLNRCWFPPHTGRAGVFAGEVLAAIRAAQPESLIDIHNNTGHNPPYGVTPRIGARELDLIALFAKRVIHSPLQLGTLIEATQDDFPSVTIECGRTGDPNADAVALAGLERYLHEGSATIATPDALEVFANPRRISLLPDVDLAFGEAPDPSVAFTVASDIDRHNFERLEPGIRIGWLRGDARWPIAAIGPDGRDDSHALFVRRDGALFTRTDMTPIMMTTNHRVALDDCLFYVVDPASGSRSVGAA